MNPSKLFKLIRETKTEIDWLTMCCRFLDFSRLITGIAASAKVLGQPHEDPYLGPIAAGSLARDVVDLEYESEAARRSLVERQRAVVGGYLQSSPEQARWPSRQGGGGDCSSP